MERKNVISADLTDMWITAEELMKWAEEAVRDGTIQAERRFQDQLGKGQITKKRRRYDFGPSGHGDG